MIRVERIKDGNSGYVMANGFNYFVWLGTAARPLLCRD